MYREITYTFSWTTEAYVLAFNVYINTICTLDPSLEVIYCFREADPVLLL